VRSLRHLLLLASGGKFDPEHRQTAWRHSVIGWLAEVRYAVSSRSALLYFDGALVAPPACADTSEPRDKIDTAAATVTMLFAMSSSIWLQQINLRVSDARHRDDPCPPPMSH
jgi:hypothetical protein